MALRFIANAQDIPNKWTITVSGTWAAADTATITINGKNLTVTIGAAVAITDVIAALVAAFNGATAVGTETRNTTGDLIPEMAGITAAAATATTITLIGDVAGEPHTITVSEVTAGSGALAIAETTAATGKNWWSNAANWTGGAVPVNTNDVSYDHSATPIKYGFAQSAVTLNSLRIENLQAGAGIGLPKDNPAGYTEYRATELAIGATTLIIDDESASIVKINFGSVANASQIIRTGFGETGLPAVMLRGTSTANTLETIAGTAGYGIFGEETGDLATFRNVGADVLFGPGTGTIETVDISGGTAQGECNLGTVGMSGGTFTHRGTGTLTDLVITGGTFNDRSSGAYGTVEVENALFDASGDLSEQTIGEVILNSGGEFQDPDSRVTVTTFTKGLNATRMAAA